MHPKVLTVKVCTQIERSWHWVHLTFYFKLSKKAWVPLERCTVIQGHPMRKAVPQESVKEVIRFLSSRPEERLNSIRQGLQVRLNS